MKWIAAVVVLAAALWIADKLLLRAEERGWIFYRRRKASPGTVASAMLELHGFVQPGARNTSIVLRDESVKREDDDEGGSEPGTRNPEPVRTRNPERTRHPEPNLKPGTPEPGTGGKQ